MSVRVLPLLVLSGLCASAGAQGRAEELVREHRFVEALEDVAREPDPLVRARLGLWVHHHAGDLQGALEISLVELRAHPEDPFLLEQAGYIAISLGDGERAIELLSRLEVLTTSGELEREDAERYAQSVEVLLNTAEELVAAEAAQGSALRLARASSLGALGLLSLLIGWLTWSTARPRS